MEFIKTCFFVFVIYGFVVFCMVALGAIFVDLFNEQERKHERDNIKRTGGETAGTVSRRFFTSASSFRGKNKSEKDNGD